MTALRQLRFPIVLIAAAILVLQSLVAGLSGAQAAGQRAAGGIALFCHVHGGDGTVPSGKAAHDCCTFCTASGPAVLAPGAAILERLAILRRAEPLVPARGLHRLPRAIRAGPSQAPPTVS